MSTDDLTRRARAEVRTLDAVPEAAYTSALVSELADEVDRLRAENERQEEFMTMQSQMDQKHMDRLTSERDAARAALSRVRDLAVLAEQGVSGFAIADALTRALEGKS